ncbi:MAG TPA: DUF4236 domain-containing protein [Terriglobales bacterium]|nr:DUF4236 domain-containing protein [Terriglobales bacterium]
MAYLRYFRRVQIAPGVRLNLTGRGASVSVGVRGAHVTLGRSGVRRTVGLPGSGLFYTSRTGYHTGLHSSPHFAPGSGGGARAGGSGCVVVVLAGLAALLALLRHR